jgi:hypothetical protein
MTSKKHAASQPGTQPATQGKPAQSADSRLDEALQESFPASDPIAVDLTDPHHATVKPVSSGMEKKRH